MHFAYDLVFFLCFDSIKFVVCQAYLNLLVTYII